MKRFVLMAVLLAGTGTAALFCGGSRETETEMETASAPPDMERQVADLTAERNRLIAEGERLTAEMRRLARTPVTREIVRQIGESRFSELEYFISIPLEMIEANHDEWPHSEEGSLVFTETTTSILTSISPDTVGRFQRWLPEGFRQADGEESGGVFEISFPPVYITLAQWRITPSEEVVLGFALNRSRNCFDLVYRRLEDRIAPFNFAPGTPPRLLIRYQTEFLGDLKIQVIVPADSGASPVSGSGGVTALPPETAVLPETDEDEGFPENSAGPQDDFFFAAPLPFPETASAGPEASAGISGEIPSAGRTPALESEPFPETASAGPEAPAGISGEILSAGRASAFEPEPLFSTGSGPWIIQVGAYEKQENAENAWNRLKSAGFSPGRDSFNGYTRVFISGVEDADVEEFSLRMEILGFDQPFIRKAR